MYHIPKKIVSTLYTMQVYNNIFLKNFNVLQLIKYVLRTMCSYSPELCSHEVLLTQYRSVTRVKKIYYTMKSL